MSVVAELFGKPDPEKVVRDHGPQVYRHLKRIFGPQRDIDDVYQNVFVEVLRSLPSFQGRSKLSTWIRRITWNVAYQEMRGRYRRPFHASIEDPMGADLDAEDATLAHVHRSKLYAAVEQLDSKQRVAVLMHDVEGHTLKEISQQVGSPLQTVASRLRTGRARLCELMQASPQRSGKQKQEKQR